MNVVLVVGGSREQMNGRWSSQSDDCQSRAETFNFTHCFTFMSFGYHSKFDTACI